MIQNEKETEKWGPSPSKFGKNPRFKYELEEQKLKERSPGPQASYYQHELSKLRKYDSIYSKSKNISEFNYF